MDIIAVILYAFLIISTVGAPFIIIPIIIISIYNKAQRSKKLQQSKNPPQNNPHYIAPYQYDQPVQRPLLPYILKEGCLTNAELHFYTFLRGQLKESLHICPKVGLKDIFCIPNNHPEYMHHFGRIAQKHVDFLICDANTMTPIFAIELDDSSHQTYKVQKRDELVNDIYNDAGLLLIRIRVKYQYTRQDLAPYISDHLKDIQYS